ncbi:MAG: nuclear transport factor 2 family protein [Verrucomicrobiota bacterium]
MKIISLFISSVIILLTGKETFAGSNAPQADAFVRDFYAAYKAKDAARMAEFYTATATFVDPSFELDLKGPDQIRELLTKALAKYESLDFQIAHTTPAGDHLIVEGSMIGKLGGKTVRVPFISIFQFRGGKIAAQRDMFDVTHFLVQLGVVPPPFGPKQPTNDKKTTTDSGELLQTITRADTAMFDAFNAHNVDALMALFTEDVEFYHDTGGLTNYPQTKENFKKLFANTPDIRRDLVKGTLEVYPIKDYGAIEIGAHRFCHEENGKEDCGSFKFVQVWRKTGDGGKFHA